MHLVLQHRCKTSWIAMLRVLPPTSNLACTKSGLLTGLNMGGKTRNNDFQLRCSNVAKQVACFLLPVFPYLKKLLYLFKVVLSTSKHLQASFQGSKRTDVPHTNCTTQKKIAKLQNNNIIFWGNREKRDDKSCKTWPKPANRYWCLSEEGIYHYRVDS